MIDTFANFHVNVHDNICSPYLPSLRILRKETYLRYRVFLLYKHLSLRISSLFLFLLIVIAIYRVFRYISPPFHSQTGHCYIPKLLCISRTLYQFPITMHVFNYSAIYLLPVSWFRYQDRAHFREQFRPVLFKVYVT